jgi:hypothetical protein
MLLSFILYFFSSYSFFLDLITFTIVSQIILNYTQNRDKNSTKKNDGKTKKGWKPFSPRNKLVQDSEVYEENGYPDPDPNKTKIDYPKEHNEAHKNTLKEEITDNFMELL